jgi:TPR repeat protein
MTMSRWAPLLVFVFLGCHRSNGQQAYAQAPLNASINFIGCSNATECERGCAAGYAGACNEAGRLYEYGHVGPRDPERAFPLYERSCALGNATGCYNAALSLELGRGSSRDTRRAASLYLEACRMGSKTGCGRAEELAELGGTKPRDSLVPTSP